MLRNYLKIALRSLRKHRVISFINIFGLAVGIACGLLIFLFIREEASYDRFNLHADRTYRIVKDFVNDDNSRLPDATTPPVLAPAMLREIPEVEQATRFFPGWGRKYLIRYGEKTFTEERVFRVDSNFFDVFTFPFVEGTAVTAFKQLNSIVITQTTARKYFGAEDPMDKVLRTDIGDMKVTGVLKDLPGAAHFHFDFLVSINKLGGNVNTQWDWYNFYTYVRLKPHTDIGPVVAKVQALYQKNNTQGKNIFYAQPLTDIHLRSDLKWEIEPNGNALYIYIFSIIGLFVIAIACVNYINLSTAKASLRSKEIGIRKVTGALRGALIRQFLTESLLTVLLSFVLALALARLLLPSINLLIQKNLSLGVLADPVLLGVILAAILLIGLAAGIYPALYLSGIRPVLVLKGQRYTGRPAFDLRKALVTFQFTISVALIAGTVVMVQQIHYAQNAKLGFNKDQVMVIDGAGDFSHADREAMLGELAKTNGVDRAASATGVLGGLNSTTFMNLKGSQNSQLINFIGISYDYLDVLGIHIKEGRNFSAAFPSDTPSSGFAGQTSRLIGSVILNETAVRDLGIHEPAVGQLIQRGKDNDTIYYVRVIGVVDDFHFASFKRAIKPFAFLLNNNWQDNFTVKVAPAGLDHTIAQIGQEWKRFSPDRPFHYTFLDEAFSNLYQSDQRFNQVVLYLTILAIGIGCMGLFGLTAFMIERRTKEIGVRKVIGASATGIVVLLSRDFVRLVLLAVLIATPIAWFVLHKWLGNFAYRISIQWWVFVLAGGVAVFIALLTVSFQAIGAALANPVKSLRSE
jgi:putative ABC transport system permease protein